MKYLYLDLSELDLHGHINVLFFLYRERIKHPSLSDFDQIRIKDAAR